MVEKNQKIVFSDSIIPTERRGMPQDLKENEIEKNEIEKKKDTYRYLLGYLYLNDQNN